MTDVVNLHAQVVSARTHGELDTVATRIEQMAECGALPQASARSLRRRIAVRRRLLHGGTNHHHRDAHRIAHELLKRSRP